MLAHGLCSVIDCGPPSVPDNGIAVYTTTEYQSTANYSCNFGYELNPTDSVVRTCGGNELWSGPNPTCDGEHAHTHTHNRTHSQTHVHSVVQCTELSSLEKGSNLIASTPPMTSFPAIVGH